jgi:hypothetical protein
MDGKHYKFFQSLVITTVHDISQLTTEELIQRAKDLDKEALVKPYLEFIKKREGNLLDFRATVTDMFHPDEEDKTDYDRSKIMRIFVARRQLGRTIADDLGWDEKDEFGKYTRHASIAIGLCTIALRKLSPKNL